MDISDYLESMTLLTCTGTTSHRLTLLPSGHVEVDTGAVKAIVDPATKTVLRPRGCQLPDQVMDHAAALAYPGQTPH